jgi:hypothetical protein
LSGRNLRCDGSSIHRGKCFGGWLWHLLCLQFKRVDKKVSRFKNQKSKISSHRKAFLARCLVLTGKPPSLRSSSLPFLPFPPSSITPGSCSQSCPSSRMITESHNSISKTSPGTHTCPPRDRDSLHLYSHQASLHPCLSIRTHRACLCLSLCLITSVDPWPLRTFHYNNVEART